MTTETFEIVRAAVARYLGVSPVSLSPDDDLRSGLGLDHVDLTLIVLGFEGTITWSELPLASLDDTRTLSELSALLGPHLGDAVDLCTRRERDTLVCEGERATVIPDGESDAPRPRRKDSGVVELFVATSQRARGA
ncbi:MAG: acyl carrier protein [Polyangiaceae bacterium]